MLDLSDETVRSGWLGHPPASDAAIVEAEARLGSALPPSLREFYAITDGWPITSIEFGSIVPVEHLQLFRDAEPMSFDIWTEDGEDNGYKAILGRAILLSDGADQMLLDPGRVGDDGEWTSFGLTSWYPGIDDEKPSFRAGLEGHYASFVELEAPESGTHDLARTRVDEAYGRLLAGDLSAESDLRSATEYGNDRASVLLIQLDALRSGYRAGQNLMIYLPAIESDPVADLDLLPMLVTSALDPLNSSEHILDSLLDSSTPAPLRATVAVLVDRHRQDGGLRASYGGAFGERVERVRALVRANRPVEAWDAFIDALPVWQAASELHLAPMAVAWDLDLRDYYTGERLGQMLRTGRGVN